MTGVYVEISNICFELLCLSRNVGYARVACLFRLHFCFFYFSKKWWVFPCKRFHISCLRLMLRLLTFFCVALSFIFYFFTFIGNIMMIHLSFRKRWLRWCTKRRQLHIFFRCLAGYVLLPPDHAPSLRQLFRFICTLVDI